jgi:TIR domain
VYRDEEAFGAGESTTAEIRDHLHRATVFVAVWCKEYACSPWCFDEIELAISRHKEGKLELWILCVDETRIVPPAARELTAFHTRTRTELESVILKLLRKMDETAK